MMIPENINNETIFNIRKPFIVCLILIAATICAYGSLYQNGFVNFDDEMIISHIKVQTGLNLENINWAFSVMHKDGTFWRPLTWISHMLDYQMAGIDPLWHHANSLVLHILNIVLIFIILKRLTGDLWPSAFVAAAFALHPANVEAVAWIAQRHSPLSTFFWLLTMWAYGHYADRPGTLRYLAVLMVFMLGLMVKPMLVTLPCALLLLDVWPLKRLQCHAKENDGSLKNQPDGNKTDAQERSEAEKFDLRLMASSFSRLLIEKIPMFILTGLTLWLSLIRKGSALIPTETIPLSLRISNALVAYAKYLGMLIWPSRLAAYYPYPDTVAAWQVIAAVLLLTCISVIVVVKLKTKPYMAIGWFWYLGTLVPVLGLVHGGLQPALADRYTYVPFLGLFIIIGWGIKDLIGSRQFQQVATVSIAVIALSLLAYKTNAQVKTWEDSRKLFAHALSVVGDNAVIHNNLAVALVDQGKPADAIKHFKEAIRLTPDKPGGYSNLANALSQLKKYDEAIAMCRKALRIDPKYDDAYSNLGFALTKQGKIKEATGNFKKAISLNPYKGEPYNNLGVIMVQKEKIGEAIVLFKRALYLNRIYAEAHNNLGIALTYKGEVAKAVYHFRQALILKPNYPDARKNLKKVLSFYGKEKLVK